jgi:hypothetical protein
MEVRIFFASSTYGDARMPLRGFFDGDGYQGEVVAS